MVTQLIKIVSMSLLLLFSCNGKIHERKKIIETEKIEKNINFFDKKYFNGYNMILDESNLSDHPYFSFLDCNNEGYFSVHLVPKEYNLRLLWMEDYYKTTDFNTYDFEKDNERISKILKNNLNDYNIFSYLVKPNYLNTNNGCTVESVYLNENSNAEIYFYDKTTDNWKLLKKLHSDTLPPYADNSFFLTNFPNLFSSNKTQTKSLKDWEGVYLNSGDKNLKTYQSIIDKVGWYKLKITRDKIIFSSDIRFETEYPTQAPGGIYLNQTCNYNISDNGDTLKVYSQKYDTTNFSASKVSGTNHILMLKLYKKNEKYLAGSDYIEEAEHLINSAREKTGPPFIFYKFSLEEDKD